MAGMVINPQEEGGKTQAQQAKWGEKHNPANERELPA